MTWFVYILACQGDYLYTGVTNNLNRRIDEHNTDDRLGSKFVRSHRPAKLIYNESFTNKRRALKRELEIKSWNKKKKLVLIDTLLGEPRANLIRDRLVLSGKAAKGR